MNFRAIIVGAGLSGLALAHGLHRLGIEAAVFERDPFPGARPQGYRIQLDAPGLSGLERCLPPELFESCLATAASPPPRVTVLDQHLAVLADRVVSERARSGVATSLAFDRATLRQLLLAGLPAEVHYGARFVTYEQLPDGRIAAHFADGRVVVGDLLVGADGVSSAVRRKLLPQADIEDTGLRLIYGKIPLPDPDSHRLPDWVFESIFTVVKGAGGTHMGVGPVRDYVACLVGATTDHPCMPSFAALRRLDGPELRDLADRIIGPDRPADIDRILGSWDTSTLIPLRISTAGAVRQWDCRGVTLVGDAVHAMSPVLAMGANTALRDAGELTTSISTALATGTSLHEAVRRYEADMLEYSSAMVAASRRTGQERVGQR
ncbi:MAG: FAD-dependent monooxygenase [Nocardia sp.]|uniref:FAD-dependent oxidoreductase n=1 Tax=Nocardia sp. TaxID=1821 RepID=UPI002603788F|nr:NAD(P)/FAD-dependent oxidoreductase [Nocardia sp.]MCU1645238.1 FAD-dependent monooxygenase [Nocardia sp.]